jgi:hypothetical protein
MTKYVSFFAVMLIACSSVPEGEDRGPSQRKVSSAVVDAPKIAGYVHALDRSAFKPGNGATQSNPGATKFVGTDGVFLTTGAGLTSAISNYNAPSRTRPALTNIGDIHNTRVRDYFVQAGLPSAQIGSIVAHATMHAALDPLTPEPNPGEGGVFDWYSSVIYRVVDGFKVPDSFAIARFNVDGDVVSESVYWPEMPASLLDQAKALRSLISTAPASFKAKLSSRLQGALPDDASLAQDTPYGGVVIHHSSGYSGAAAQFRVVFDIFPKGDFQHVVHVDETGAEVAIWDEGANGPSGAPATSTH